MYVCTLDLPASSSCSSALLLVEPPHVAPEGVLVPERLPAELAVHQLRLGLSEFGGGGGGVFELFDALLCDFDCCKCFVMALSVN